MRSFVLDCSVTMGWCFTDENDRYVSSVLSSLETKTTAVVPVLWATEVCNVLILSERKKRLTKADSSKFLNLLGSLPITFDASLPNMHEICGLARAQRLTSYDASYLELAMRTGFPLVTTDAALRKAAQTVGVELFR